MEGHNWVLNQFVEIHWRSIIACSLSLSAKVDFKPPTMGDQLFVTTVSERIDLRFREGKPVFSKRDMGVHCI
jgi:hypothetical protein